jgi:hypothetical protein
MTTKRMPIHRELRQQFTPAVLAAFRDLRDAPPGSDAWWRLHNHLHRLVGAKLWEWPCVEPPDAERNYEVQPEAVALWAELEQALERRITQAGRPSRSGCLNAQRRSG